jgi:Uma2 family endonuclease
MTALPKRYFTPEEYLELEVKADYKSQYVAGEIFAMYGAQPPHVFIESNLIGELRNRLRGRGCNVFTSNMRVKAESADLYTYPDVSVLCGKPEFDYLAKPESLLNPQVIFEVLSPSTELFDRGDKFARYRKIPSLTDYVLVASELMRVEHYVRQEGDAWMLTEYSRPEQTVRLRSVDCELPLEEIYYQVTFREGNSAR